jgi:hypothetical protein
MELKIDLIKEKGKGKSLFRVILGICFLLVSIGLPIAKIIDHDALNLFDWIFFGAFLINGLIYIVSKGIFGKAFILINSELISLKASVFDKEQSIGWSNIKSIDYKHNMFIIKKTDDTTMIMDLSKFGYVFINEIKKTVNDIAKEKTFNRILVSK